MITETLLEGEALDITLGKLGEDLRQKLQKLGDAGFTHAVVLCNEDSFRSCSSHTLTGVRNGEIRQALKEIWGRGLKPKEIVDLETFQIRDGPNPHLRLV